jgi:RHS repeat-associated protein
LPRFGGCHLFLTFSSPLFLTDDRLAQMLGAAHMAQTAQGDIEVRTASWTVYDNADHAVTFAQGYAMLDTSDNQWDLFTLVNPVSVTLSNPNGQVTSQVQATVDTASGVIGWTANAADNEVYLGSLSPLTLLAPTTCSGNSIGLPTQSSYVSWTTYEYSHEQLVSTRVYYAIPESGTGTAAANYNETDYGYNAVGTQIWAETPDGTITWNVLNAAGLVLSTWEGTDDNGATPTDPTGGHSLGNNMVEVSSNLYDPDGDVISTTQFVDSNSADNRVTVYGYDWQDRLVSTMTFDGTYYTYTYNTYDNQGEVIETQQFQAATPWTVNPAGDLLLSQSTTDYDALGEVYQSTEYLVTSGLVGTAEITSYSYDADGNQVSLTDPAPDSNTTTWTYDGLDQVKSQTDALGQTDYYYDGAGEMYQQTDADDRTTLYTYDAVGRETGESWHAAASGRLTETIGCTYNPAGLLVSATDDNLLDSTVAVDSYQYDAAGEVTSESETIPGLAPVVTLSSQYTAGDRTQLAATIGTTADFVNTYQYAGPYGQMSQVTQTGATGGDAVAAKTVTFQYDNLGEYSTISRYQNADPSANLVAQSTYGYNTAGELTSLNYADANGNTLENYQWSYDALGNMVQSSNTYDGTTVYTSDSTGQLLTAANTTTPVLNENFSYDSNGNRTNSGYQTGPNNELLSDGTYTYSYDGEGNQTARWVNNNGVSESSPQSGDTDVTIYTWDNRNRLTSMTQYANYDAYKGLGSYNSPTPEMTVTYIYDAFDRWIGETVTAYSGGSPSSVQTTDFVYDGNQIVLQFDKDGTGNVTANDLSHRYLNGPAVDQVLADEQVTNLQTPGNVVWTLTDNEGTVRDLATYNAQTGVTTVANHRSLDSYGNLTSQTNAAVDCLFGLAGMPFDEASGTYVTPTRRYDPATGRWDSPDTDGFRGGDTNLYRYCGNAPTTSVDPTGQDRWVLTNGHWWIIVAVWDPTGTKVVGYQRLEYWPWGYVVTEPTFGTTLATLLLGLPPNPAGVKFVKPGSGGPADVGCVVGHWKSNAAQDAALLAEWRRIQQQQWDTRVAAVGRYLGYYVGWNCMSVALWWCDYGGAAGPATLIVPPPPTMPQGTLPVKCFAAGTPVLCPDGARPIELIQPGDRILAYDLDANVVVESRALRCDAYQGDFDMLEVEVSPENRIHVTTEHAFYDGREWVSSGDLAARGPILDASGKQVMVAINGRSRCNHAITYNLRTEHKTYLVGSSGLVASDRDVLISSEARPNEAAGTPT